LELDDIVVIAAGLAPATNPLRWEEFQRLPEASRQAYEPMNGGVFTARPAHNTIHLYTWGDQECCLIEGATSATLVDGWVDDGPGAADQKASGPADKSSPSSSDPSGGAGNGSDSHRPRRLALAVGDVLILEEVIGPRTGLPADADPARRHAVCLTAVKPAIDPVTGVPIVEVTWAAADALPFPLCISSREPPPDCEPLDDVSVARGNVILVDHGLTYDEPLGEVAVDTTIEACGDQCHPPEAIHVPARFRPRLSRYPVTHAAGPSPCPARDALRQDPNRALPQVALDQVLVDDEAEPGVGVGHRWRPVRDLLGSAPDDRDFVVEVDDSESSQIRFGDGESGRVPEARSRFHAIYRVGNGPAGNVGTEAISRLVTKRTSLSGVSVGVRNPMPAVGGVAPEPIEQVRLLAPHAFRRLLARAVTAADYAAIVERDFPSVQQVSAWTRFTGSHSEVLVAVDQVGSTEPEPGLLRRIAHHLERFRRIGHDVVVTSAVHVSIYLELFVCVDPSYLRAPVEAAVRHALSARRNDDGTVGLFHPDRRSFGDGVFASDIVAVVQALAGVRSVKVRALHRLYEGPMGELAEGVLRLRPPEIARLENDPSQPDLGVLAIEMGGGR
jgi:hypothetical protein